MSIVAIYRNHLKNGPMTPAREVLARKGRGIEGNRYYRPEADEAPSFEPDREITLIEAEAVESLDASGLPFDASESRRNLVTRGVDRNALVGREFVVGGARLRGLRPCDPCRNLEKLTRPGVLRGLAGRGGLRAKILDDGPIRVGDPIAVPAPVG